MNRFVGLLITILFSFSLQAEVCLPPLPGLSSTEQLTSQVTQIAEKECTKQVDDNYMDMVTGCLSGGKKSAMGLIQGFIELVKLLLVDAPTWLWNEASDKIKELINGDLNPIEMSMKIARLNLTSQSGIWDTAKKYWDEFVNFSKELKNTLVAEIKGFPCLPLNRQSEIICKGVSDVFLFVFSPTKFVQGAKWGLSTAKALKNFVHETKAVQGLENANLATRLDRASQSLKGASKSPPLLTIGTSELREQVLPDGSRVLQFTKDMVDKDGVVHRITRDVPVDAKTLAIDSNSVIGKEILNEMVKTKAGNGSLIFVDVNHLGKTNYFAGGTQAGDQYLTQVGEALRRNLRPGDMVFKNGGDELVVVLGSNNPQIIKDISQRMINSVDANPEIRHIFRGEVKSSAQKYKAINKSSSLDELPEPIVKSLSAEELNLAKADFTKFKSTKLREVQGELTDQATYRGSISIGSSIIKNNEELTSVLARAESQASKVKTEYKYRMGHDVSKYNVDPVELVGVRRWSPPVALFPE